MANFFRAYHAIFNGTRLKHPQTQSTAASRIVFLKSGSPVTILASISR
jgi:hypothetical protein